MIVYEDFLGENYMPLLHGVDIQPFFSRAFYERKVPVWFSYDLKGMLGDPERGEVFLQICPLLFIFFGGLLVGTLIFLAPFVKKRAP